MEITPNSFGNAGNFDPANVQHDDVILPAFAFDASLSVKKFKDELNNARRDMIHDWQQSHHAPKILYTEYVFSNEVTQTQNTQPIANVIAQDVNPTGLTSAIDAAYEAAFNAYTYAESLYNTGTNSKIIVVVFTDGDDNASNRTPSEVKTLLEKTIYKEGTDELAMANYEFFVFGIGDRQSYFIDLANQMGFKVIVQDPNDTRPIGKIVRDFITVVSQSVSSGSTDALNALTF